MNSTLHCLKKQRDNAERKVNPNNPKQMDAALTQIKAITAQINEVEQMRYKKSKSTAKANKRLLVETVNKYWCDWGKEKKPRDTIKEKKRKDSTPTTYTTDSTEMAMMVANHYNSMTSTSHKT